MNYNLDSQGFSLEWLKENRVFIFEHKAMATIFSVFIQHDDYTYASQAVTEAFDLLNRLEQDLSRYKENSDVARINELKSGESTVVSPDTMDCLIKCKILQDNTMGVFNPTIGDLINQSKKNKNSFKIYNKSKIGNLVLDSDSFIVSVEKNPITIDLGAIGKGYALDKMIQFFRDWEINRILLSSGRSTFLAGSAPEKEIGWPIKIFQPKSEDFITKVALKKNAISGSGIKQGNHIISPLTLRPVKNIIAAWVMASNGTEADALSTSFMMMSPKYISDYLRDNPDISALIIKKNDIEINYGFSD